MALTYPLNAANRVHQLMFLRKIPNAALCRIIGDTTHEVVYEPRVTLTYPLNAVIFI